MLAATQRAAGQATTRPSYPESNEGLAQFFKDQLSLAAARDHATLHERFKSLILPNSEAWFTDVFGDEKGPKLAEEYKESTKNLAAKLTSLFLQLRDPKLLEVTVICVETVDDPNAKAFQTLALAAMKQPVALYTAAVGKPNESAAITIWSLVYSDGQFRFVGRMTAVK